ncbi:hypothetical protein FRB96_008479 [Tulasnella sp. 330]|nr:hypothetical protein FRB96_008479 [Tulasnella sp. 330]KAG8884002.1 hypothetical protein FRB97_005446 [Tulasnella sp. 331]KAG8889326.1 hypothetical protein FRB98_004943 [Tulasnella sp. 332]
MSSALDLDFEDLLFEPSSSRSSSRSSSSSSSSTPVGIRRSREESMFDCFEPASYREPSRVGRQQTRAVNPPIPSPQPNVIQLSPAPCPNHVVCPGAAHRYDSQEEASFFVDPRSGVGKCCNSDCTWGFVNGEFIVTDLKGFAYSSRGQPVTYLDRGMYKHIRLVPQRA